MHITTTYKHIKHGYVKKMPNGDLRLSIPRRKRFDTGFKDRLIEKGKRLGGTSSRENTLLCKKISNTHVYLWGKKVQRTTLPDPVEPYLRKICLEESIRLANIYSNHLGLPYNKLRVKKVKTKRGSCSTKQNININLDLVHLDKKYIEYVIIHEVCHLKHKHHKKEFRHEVSGFLPHYKEIVKEMRHIRLS